MSWQYWAQLSDSSTRGQPERSCARHCRTQPLSTACAAVQRGEAAVAFNVTEGLLSGANVQLAVCPVVKSTPKANECRVGTPTSKRVGRRLDVSRADAFLLPYGTEIATPLSFW